MIGPSVVLMRDGINLDHFLRDTSLLHVLILVQALVLNHKCYIFQGVVVLLLNDLLSQVLDEHGSPFQQVSGA